MKRFSAILMSLLLVLSFLLGAAPARAASDPEPAAPVLSIEPGYDHADLTWEAASVKNAEGEATVSYKIYRKKNGGSWKRAAVTETLSYTDKKPRPGASYQYKVKALIKLGGASWTVDSNVVEMSTVLPVPEVTKAEATAYNRVEVTVKPEPGITQYMIYKKVGDKAWKKAGKVTGEGNEDALIFTDTKVKPGQTVSYAARARLVIGKKAYYGAYDTENPAVAHPKLNTPSINSVTASGRTIYVTWNTVEGASGYLVYRKEGDAEWKKAASLKGNGSIMYSDKETVYGTAYKYEIQAYYKKGKYKAYSEFSEEGSCNFKPKASSIKSIKTANGLTLHLTWKKTPGAEGYNVYRKNSEGKWKKIGSTQGETSLTYDDTDLTYGKTYTYCIRAYWTAKGKTQLGKKSKAVSKTLEYTSRYEGGYKLFYDDDGNLVTEDLEKVVGDPSEYEIRVNKQSNTVTVYAKDGYRGFIIPVRACITSCGNGTPTGTFYISDKYRWHTLLGATPDTNVYGQWAMRITGSIMFHTVYYYTNYDNTTLSVTAYNKLGNLDSMGCSRLTCKDAQWIYDHCGSGTKVIIYNSGNPGPLGKPTAYQLPSWHTWDPTDPNAHQYCKEHGCHQEEWDD